jgi:predicted nucleotidyltransferase component of viral defense system
MKLSIKRQLEMDDLIKMKLEVLPLTTLKLFEKLKEHENLIRQLRLNETLCLVGGTALALQIGHRRSNDLDFACFDTTLPSYAIEQFLATIQSKHNIKKINSVAQISQFKIQTGLNLNDYVQDFTIDDVKVTFFILGITPEQKEFYRKTLKHNDLWVLPIMGVKGIQLAKTLVLKNRIRSRDMYDLMVLMRDYEYSFIEFINNLSQFLATDDLEYFKAILTGKIPLDRDDEGLLPVNVEASVDEIYKFFKVKFREHELWIAGQLLK